MYELISVKHINIIWWLRNTTCIKWFNQKYSPLVPPSLLACFSDSHLSDDKPLSTYTRKLGNYPWPLFILHLRSPPAMSVFLCVVLLMHCSSYIFSLIFYPLKMSYCFLISALSTRNTAINRKARNFFVKS